MIKVITNFELIVPSRKKQTACKLARLKIVGVKSFSFITLQANNLSEKCEAPDPRVSILTDTD
jgi:hypothetical protein